ncbi:cytochrome c [Rouxiella badensis]|jgi:mono/diheme cytochrome c family protein|uniref:c-type cytochrome n=1 Tax=Rouxiella badensis TaxID=1646377 RepID=UPI0028D43452|nr:cytochrome c [Rouxiella badensis]
MKIKQLSLFVAAFISCKFAMAAPENFQEKVASGEYIATAGDCAACHTVSGSAPFTGGLKMVTPVGAIYSTNITPDKDTGIGNYSYEDFSRALRQGIAKDGHRLYPAMPYTEYAKINDDDMHALYSYLMNEVKPVHQTNRKSDIPWPLNMRWPLAAWDWAFHDSDVYKPDQTQSAEWNRGAYLVQGLTHCGTCHTPRGLAYQEKGFDQHDKRFLSGGQLAGWSAPDLTGNSKTGLGSWSAQEIAEFLKTGHTDGNAAFGPMSEAIEKSTQYLTDADLSAIATYLKSLPSSDAPAQASAKADSTSAALIKGDMSQPGSLLYMNNCSACHRIDGKGYTKSFPALAGNTAVMGDDPSSLINIVLAGAKTPVTRESITGLTMPDFAWRLNDQQVADVVTFIRSSWGNSASAVNAEEVAKLRKQSVGQPEVKK